MFKLQDRTEGLDSTTTRLNFRGDGYPYTCTRNLIGGCHCFSHSLDDLCIYYSLAFTINLSSLHSAQIILGKDYMYRMLNVSMSED